MLSCRIALRAGRQFSFQQYSRLFSSENPGKNVGDSSPQSRASSGRDEAQTQDPEEALFSSENTRNLSPTEIARMRLVYSYVKEHVDVVEKTKPPVDSSMNPLIDPRSFNVQTLPRVPDAALKQFREDMSAEEASSARALSTRVVWDKTKDSQTKASSENELRDLEGSGDDDSLWSAVDERTMDPFYFMRMRRQSMSRRPAPGSQAGHARAHPGALRSVQRHCRLSGPRGRVHVDFREVGILREFLNDHGKLMPRRRTNLSAKAQRKVSRSVKTARQMALLHPEPRMGLSVAEMIEMEKAL